MSCFSCFSSARNDSPTRHVGGEETRCAFLEENVSEGIMDLVGESSGSDKQIVSIAVPSGGRTKVLYRQSDRCLQQNESKLPAKLVKLSSPEEGESVPEFGNLLAELRRKENLTEKLTTTPLKAPEVGVETGIPVVDRSPTSGPVAPPTVSRTKEEEVNEAEAGEQVFFDYCKYRRF